MYSTIPDLLKDINKSELLLLVNDESRDPDTIVLEPSETGYDESDPCVVRINEEINIADAFIDSFLISNYTLPLTSTPILIKQLSKDLTFVYCYKRRHRLDMPESLIALEKSCHNTLRDIQKGNIKLNIPLQQDEPKTEIVSNKTSDDRVFNRTTLDMY